MVIDDIALIGPNQVLDDDRTGVALFGRAVPAQPRLKRPMDTVEATGSRLRAVDLERNCHGAVAAEAEVPAMVQIESIGRIGLEDYDLLVVRHTVVVGIEQARIGSVVVFLTIAQPVSVGIGALRV